MESPFRLWISQKKPPFEIDPKRLGYQIQFFTRMLFSCLVDGDYLDSEQFQDVDKAGKRRTWLPFDSLYDEFWPSFNQMRDEDGPSLAINKQRELVLDDCVRGAQKEPGLFSLTVPTGGGKILDSLAFALEHARKYSKKRVIYVIPFTSIIDENAGVFRSILGENAVLEHHCNYIPDESDWKARLAAQNWDAPIIVTTNVQFFDSFYASRLARCRKLHNTAQSIVIFDEVQAIPVEKIKPCLEVIREFSLNYGVSSLLCTATQPASGYSDHFKSGLKNVREIVQDIPSLFSNLKRTEEFFIKELDVKDVAAKLSDYRQVLCIVNTRKEALEIYEALPETEGIFHLRALVYPAHRIEILSEMRKQLEDGGPCRVVSTQLIEAGVNLDSPCVYRAISGIDSIAQTAGRCNRNGKSKTAQPVFFQLPENRKILIPARPLNQPKDYLIVIPVDLQVPNVPRSTLTTISGRMSSKWTVMIY